MGNPQPELYESIEKAIGLKKQWEEHMHLFRLVYPINLKKIEIKKMEKNELLNYKKEYWITIKKDKEIWDPKIWSILEKCYNNWNNSFGMIEIVGYYALTYLWAILQKKKELLKVLPKEENAKICVKYAGRRLILESYLFQADFCSKGIEFDIK